jgi:hypothetical protein
MLHAFLLGLLVTGALPLSSIPFTSGALLGQIPPPPNVIPPTEVSNPGLLAEIGLTDYSQGRTLPLADTPFIEHVRAQVAPLPDGDAALCVGFDESGRLIAGTDKQSYRLEPDGAWMPVDATHPGGSAALPSDLPPVLAYVEAGGETWVGTENGLFRVGRDGKSQRHEEYGVNGPLATRVTALAVTSDGTLWAGTPRGLSLRHPDGSWTHVTGREGLPYEDVTALAVTTDGDIWIGTTKGAILHRPQTQDRRWYYRQGKRYLPSDRVHAIAVAPDGKAVYFATDGGLGRLDFVERTLYQKAELIEEMVNKRHRRLGLVAACVLDDPENPTSSYIPDNDNDGLWTAYHVAAMSLAYAVTGEEKYKQSAKESMHALVMLQNASGTPGLVARSVLPPEEGRERNARLNAQRARRGQPPFEQWQPTPDGKFYWKSDTSSDEIDGHYLAFYTYYAHVAQSDPAERELIRKQVTDVTNYIVDNNYQLIDWTGKRTRWGFWNPESLNDDPEHYAEAGLNALEILSFLKTAHFITENPKFEEHYRKLIDEHGYLGNILLEKKVFPDQNNHSDDQLAFVAWYPILQLEKDPEIRRALYGAVRRHYVIEEPESASFFFFPYATMDPDHTNIEAAVQHLRQIPTDRRQWRQENSTRADVVFDPRLDRFGSRQLVHVLPADEWCFGKWNRNPYVPDEGGDGREEDDGAHYLLPYWMGRYHGFIAAPE